jgi:hypothetical protein
MSYSPIPAESIVLMAPYARSFDKSDHSIATTTNDEDLYLRYGDFIQIVYLFPTALNARDKVRFSFGTERQGYGTTHVPTFFLLLLLLAFLCSRLSSHTPLTERAAFSDSYTYSHPSPQTGACNAAGACNVGGNLTKGCFSLKARSTYASITPLSRKTGREPKIARGA